jgi:hypothetical protein
MAPSVLKIVGKGTVWWWWLFGRDAVYNGAWSVA